MQRKIKLFLLITALTWQGCFVRKTPGPDVSGLTRDSVKIENGSDQVDTAKLIRRQNKDLVILSFFEMFNDTLIVYVNGKEQARLFIHEKNNPYTSTGYSGVDFQLMSKKKKNKVTIQLLLQKRYIEFLTDTQYPLYIIQRYGETWYARSTKEYLNLK